MMSQKNIKEHHLNWLQFFDHQYRIVIVGSSGSGKTNSLGKGYLCYKAITSQNVSSEAQVKNFFVL